MEIGARELKNHVGMYLGRVESGESLTITRRGKPVARIIPANIDRGIEKLIVEGRATWNGRRPGMPKPVKMRGKGKSLSDYVIEGRR